MGRETTQVVLLQIIQIQNIDNEPFHFFKERGDDVSERYFGRKSGTLKMLLSFIFFSMLFKIVKSECPKGAIADMYYVKFTNVGNALLKPEIALGECTPEDCKVSYVQKASPNLSELQKKGVVVTTICPNVAHDDTCDGDHDYEVNTKKLYKVYHGLPKIPCHFVVSCLFPVQSTYLLDRTSHRLSQIEIMGLKL